MSWWKDFNVGEVGRDFRRIAAGGLDSVRLFLTWEDFQPTPDQVDLEMLGRLVMVADQAQAADLKLMPTLFTGHMSGVNWIPAWALTPSPGNGRFRVVSGGDVSRARLRNWYEDPDVIVAQTLRAEKAAEALAGHDALWAWALGNENSNCVVPPSRSAARRWLQQISTAIRQQDDTAVMTLGLHMEDLEEDRNLGPGEAAAVCDLLTMHGYPIYAHWAESRTDEHVLAFLAHMTRWLGGGGDLLFSEFGVPTFISGGSTVDGDGPVLTDEQTAAAYTERALGALHRAGCIGAMIWCYSDYEDDIWARPPFDVATHERFFGLWRADGSPKPSLEAVERFSGINRIEPPAVFQWIDIEPGEFYRNPRFQLEHLYRRYRQAERPNSP